MERGKLICNILKDVRRKIAEANGIEYIPAKCNHRGDCMGICPMCEAELQYLEQELEKKRLAKEIVNVVGVAEFGKDMLLNSQLKQYLNTVTFENKKESRRLMGRTVEEHVPQLQGKLASKKKKNWIQRLFDRFLGWSLGNDSL